MKTKTNEAPIIDRAITHPAIVPNGAGIGWGADTDDGAIAVGPASLAAPVALRELPEHIRIANEKGGNFLGRFMAHWSETRHLKEAAEAREANREAKAAKSAQAAQ